MISKVSQSLLISIVIISLSVNFIYCQDRNKEPVNTILKDETYQTVGIKDSLPVFYNKLANRLTFPLSWLSGNYNDFTEWRKLAREKVLENLLYAPPAVPFDPVIIREEDRGSYIANRVVLNISSDSRILAYLLVPKGEGPFPGMLLLHDHGARFDIGKEKMVRPFDESEERVKSSEEWVNENYGGRYVGDELAKQGYMCFITDALNWGDRSGGWYEGQQAIAANLFNLGASFASVIAYEDIRAADFLAMQPKIDKSKIGAIGWSMGAFRTWQIAALSDHINAGIAICWLSSIKELIVPGNNMIRGNSAYSMTHPGVFNYFDYPDIASIACPKPMLFFNGLKDDLFPVSSVEHAYEKMYKIWKSQNADPLLYTKLWDTEHTFNLEMQEEVFLWLKENLLNKN